MKKPTLRGAASKRPRRPASKPASSSARLKDNALNTAKASGPPPRHPAAPPHMADHQHLLPGPPSRHTTARTRATTPHDSATRSPSCTGLTARRPRPPRQHPGPPPWPKSQPPPPRRINRADNLAALATQGCHPNPCQPQNHPIEPQPHRFPRPPPRHPTTESSEFVAKP
jgi:hypothetical protein